MSLDAIVLPCRLYTSFLAATLIICIAVLIFCAVKLPLADAQLILLLLNRVFEFVDASEELILPIARALTGRLLQLLRLYLAPLDLLANLLQKSTLLGQLLGLVEAEEQPVDLVRLDLQRLNPVARLIVRVSSRHDT